MSASGRRPSPMSTMVPTSMRTMWWRNRSASTWKLTPRPSGRSRPLGDARAGSDSAAWARPWRRRPGSRARRGAAWPPPGAARSVERPAERPLEGPAKRRGRGGVGADVVAVAAARARSCGRGSPGASASTRSTQQSRGSRALSARCSVGRGPVVGSGEADAEPDRVHPGIGPTGGVGHGRGARRGARARARTRLGPSGRRLGAATRQSRCRRSAAWRGRSGSSARNLAVSRPPGQATQLLVTIDKSASRRIHFSTLPAPFHDAPTATARDPGRSAPLSPSSSSPRALARPARRRRRRSTWSCGARRRRSRPPRC